MHSSLRSKFLQIEDDLNKLIRDLADVAEEKLSTKPAGGGWSIMEVMQHLIVVEKSSLAYAKKKSSYPDNFKKVGPGDGLRKVTLWLFLRLPIKVKAPSVVNEAKFDQEADFDDLVEQWRQIRFEMMDFLEDVPDEHLDKLLFRHPFAGRMTLDGMLMNIRDHFRRHRKQIDRLLNE